MIKKFFSILLLTAAMHMQSQAFFFPPVGRNLARQSSNLNFLYWPDEQPHAFDFAATFEYERSFDERKGLRALDARRNLCHPIENYIGDFNIRFDLGAAHNSLEGLYFRVNAPVAHTRWKLKESFDLEEESLPTEESSKSSAPDALVPADNSEDSDVNSASDSDSDVSSEHESEIFRDSRTELANLDLILGYNFAQGDTYHVGAYLLAIAPTARRHKTELIPCAPHTGSTRWEFGGGLQGHCELWSCSDDHSLIAYFEGYATRIFKDKHYREFADLRGNVQGEALVQFIYRYGSFATGLGYNFYGRGAEEGARRHSRHSASDSSEKDLMCSNDGCSSKIFHRVFGHIDYGLISSEYAPFIGIGGQVDLAQKKHGQLNNWGIWFKTGFSF
jgi:hypothetical protein